MRCTPFTCLFVVARTVLRLEGVSVWLGRVCGPNGGAAAFRLPGCARVGAAARALSVVASPLESVQRLRVWKLHGTYAKAADMQFLCEGCRRAAPVQWLQVCGSCVKAADMQHLCSGCRCVVPVQRLQTCGTCAKASMIVPPCSLL